MIAGKKGRQLGHQRPVLGGSSGLQLFFHTGHIYLLLDVSVLLGHLGWQAGKDAAERPVAGFTQFWVRLFNVSPRQT